MKTLNFTIFFLLIFANLGVCAEKVDLAEHGEDLMKAPFAARYHFYNRYQKDWIYSSYDERKDFLTDWHQKLIDERTKKKVQDKELVLKEREEERLKKEALKKEKERIEYFKKQAKAEHEEFENRGKNFDQAVRSAERNIRELQRSSSP